MVTGRVINPDRTVAEIDLSGPDDGLAAMQAAVGGYIEAVMVPIRPSMILWINEDAPALHLPLNQWATMFLGAPVLGPVILTGGHDGSGGVLEIPAVYRPFLPGPR